MAALCPGKLASTEPPKEYMVQRWLPDRMVLEVTEHPSGKVLSSQTLLFLKDSDEQKDQT